MIACLKDSQHKEQQTPHFLFQLKRKHQPSKSIRADGAVPIEHGATWVHSEGKLRHSHGDAQPHCTSPCISTAVLRWDLDVPSWKDTNNGTHPEHGPLPPPLSPCFPGGHGSQPSQGLGRRRDVHFGVHGFRVACRAVGCPTGWWSLPALYPKISHQEPTSALP